MKSLKTLIRIIIVGLCWSLFFFEGIRVILLTNWHFDLIDSRHWKYVWDLWMSGWVIDDSREWAFILIILSFIPLWLTGWASLSLIRWEQMLAYAAEQAVKLYRRLMIKIGRAEEPKPAVPQRPVIKKKKSYKEIRPRGLTLPTTGQNDHPSLPPLPSVQPSQPVRMSPLSAAPIPTPSPNTSILDHSLFKLDDNDDDFDLNFDDLDKINSQPQVRETHPAEKNQPTPHHDNNRRQERPEKDNKRDGGNERSNHSKDNGKDNQRKNGKPLPMSNQPQSTKNSGNSSLEVIKQKGYQVITSATLKNNFVDFIGVAEGQICICLVDKESGDWLADEERFNDEEPLWFSENSHRISPVRCADIVQDYLSTKLKENGFDFDISTFVVIQYGNIINAEDMFETWQTMNINVTRIDRGMPRELKLFAKTLDEADKSIDIERFEKIKKIIRNLT